MNFILKRVKSDLLPSNMTCLMILLTSTVKTSSLVSVINTEAISVKMEFLLNMIWRPELGFVANFQCPLSAQTTKSWNHALQSYYQFSFRVFTFTWRLIWSIIELQHKSYLRIPLWISNSLRLYHDLLVSFSCSFPQWNVCPT